MEWEGKPSYLYLRGKIKNFIKEKKKNKREIKIYIHGPGPYVPFGLIMFFFSIVG